MKRLTGLRVCQRSVERLGCIKGCLEYLGSEADAKALVVLGQIVETLGAKR